MLWLFLKAVLLGTVAFPTVALFLVMAGQAVVTRTADEFELLPVLAWMALAGVAIAMCVLSLVSGRAFLARLRMLRQAPAPRDGAAVEGATRELQEDLEAALLGPRLPVRRRPRAAPVAPFVCFAVTCAHPWALAVVGALVLLRLADVIGKGLFMLALLCAIVPFFRLLLQFMWKLPFRALDWLLTWPQMRWNEYVNARFAIGLFRVFEPAIDRTIHHRLAPVLGAYGKIYIVKGPYYKESPDPWRVAGLGRVGQLQDVLADVENAVEFTDAGWKRGVEWLAHQVDIAVVNIDEISPSTYWELVTCLRALPRGRVVLTGSTDRVFAHLHEVVAQSCSPQLAERLLANVIWFRCPPWYRPLKLRVEVLRLMRRLGSGELASD